MEVDFKRFNGLGPKEQARLIVEAGCKARGRPAPVPDKPKFVGSVQDPTVLAAMIVRVPLGRDVKSHERHAKRRTRIGGPAPRKCPSSPLSRARGARSRAHRSSWRRN